MFRSRLLRIVLIAFGVIAVAAYGTFTALFFNPFESDFSNQLTALVPRDVDFCVAKRGLGDAFDKFPHLAIEKKLKQNPRWKDVGESPEWNDLAKSLKVDETLQKLAEATSQIPLGVEPPAIFGGRAIAIAGYLRGTDLEHAEWAAYGRSNWMGKLAAAGLEHPGLFGLEKRGLSVEASPDGIAVSGAGLPRKLYVTRMHDVVIVSTTVDLTKKAIALPAKGFQDSLFQSAEYFDWVQKAHRGDQRDEFEIYVDARKAIAGLGLPKAWPDPKSQEFKTALLGHVFQLGSLKNVAGVLGFDEGLSLDLHGDLSSEQITPEQERLYRTRGFDRNALEDAARLAPRNTSLFVYFHAPVGDFLRMMLASCEPALKQNLEDFFRSTGKYPSLDKLVADLDSALKDRAAIIIRPNDYPVDPEGPPHNDAPVPAMALVLWPKNFETINALRQLIGNQGGRIGLQGKTPNDPGFFQNAESGYETREFWSQHVDGTGVIVAANAAQLTIVTNSLGMMGHLLKTYTQKSDRYPSLADDEGFLALVQSSIPQASLVAYANPSTIAPILRNRAQQVATIAATHGFDPKAEREKVDAKILREQYGGKTRDALSPPEQAEFDAKGEEEMKATRRRLKEEGVPKLMAEEERHITWMEGVTNALLMLSLNPKSVDLSVRVNAPLVPEKK